MTNDGWGKEWPKPIIPKEQILAGEAYIKAHTDIYGTEINPVALGIKVRSNNLHPTHDPYTNPDSHIYYQCNCGAILDPGTKSFSQLCKAASESNWKIRFGTEYYKAYCVKCGEGVE